MGEHESEVAEVTSALKELKVQSPKFLLADSEKMKRFNPSLREVIEFAKIPFDEDVLTFSFDKKKFKLSVHIRNTEIEFVYQHRLRANNPHAIISAVVNEAELPESKLSTKGRSWQSIYFRGRSLRSYKLDLVQKLILEDLLQLKHTHAAYTVQIRESKSDIDLTTRFVVETDSNVSPEEFLKDNALEQDDALEIVKRDPTPLKEEGLVHMGDQLALVNTNASLIQLLKNRREP